MHRAPHFPSRAYVECPHWTKLVCLTISLILMTTLVEWQSISWWHCQSTPPHLWSLCNDPKSWDNVWRPTFPFHVSATFVPSHSTFYSRMPPAFHLALGLPPIAKSKASEWISKSLSKLGNFNIGTFTKMPFKVSKASLHASFHS